ncbi:hypothetical protein KGF56_001480 [Candida oxycetoniae]|uniref:SCP domain-containing protein n=1 Tax=Candida oxycetoniae TaxID=497107 RepID=A0AAI9WZ07_9ASCO|nr:uncharacterized protein KGF56_001480 [Candida oxycetoniae]KAI3405872.1 hypothetical protein KGF56_001480 [Candida oxycetoniae]
MKFASIATIATTCLGFSLAGVIYHTQTIHVTQYATVAAGEQPAESVPTPTPSTSTWVFSTNVLGHEFLFTSVIDDVENISEDFVTLYYENAIIKSGDSLTTESRVVQVNPTTLVTSLITEDPVASSPVAEEAVESVAAVAAAASPVAEEAVAASPVSPELDQDAKASPLIATFSVDSPSTPVSTTPVIVAQTTTLEPSASPSASSSENSDFGNVQDVSFAKAILDAHNNKRARHNAPALKWDQAAYNYAQNYANQYSCTGNLKHSGGKFGENLGVGYPDGPSVVNAWYQEGDSYNYNAANVFDHFTATVWKSTTKLGCAYKDCRAQNWGLYIICSYDPAGNVVGRSKENVLPLSN